MNSKQCFNSNNRLENAAIKGDNKPPFPKKLARVAWLAVTKYTEVYLKICGRFDCVPIMLYY